MTFMARPVSVMPLHRLTAFSAARRVRKVTNAQPRELPDESRSSLSSTTSPTISKAFRSAVTSVNLEQTA